LRVDDLDRLFNPSNYLGAAEALVDRALEGESKDSHAHAK